MKKATFQKIVTCVLAVIFLSACHKHNIAPSDYNDQTFNYSSSTNESSKLQIANYKGVYIDGFSNKLGNTQSEDSVLNWCQKNGLNEMSLYGLNTILSTASGISNLNSFIAKAHSATYNIHVSVVASSQTTASKEYNTYYVSNPNKFDAITSEYEYWNTGNSFSTFQTQLQYMNSINASTAGAIKRQLYISKFSDAAGVVLSDTSICRQVVQSADRIFLVNYSNNAYNMSTTTLNKIKAIANESKKLNKVTEIIILFNVNTASVDPNIFSYFDVNSGNHNFIEAYSKFKTDYNLVSFTNKTSVKLNGFQLYNYSNAADARP